MGRLSRERRKKKNEKKEKGEWQGRRQEGVRELA